MGNKRWARLAGVCGCLLLLHTGMPASGAETGSLPVVTILSPAMADTYGCRQNTVSPGTDIIVSAVADGVEAAKQMRLYCGEDLLYECGGDSLSYVWSGAPSGGHLLVVEAETAAGAVGREWTYVTVEEPETGTPVEWWIGPPDQAAVDGTFDSSDGGLPDGWEATVDTKNGFVVEPTADGADGTAGLLMGMEKWLLSDKKSYIEASGLGQASGTLVVELKFKRNSESSASGLRNIIAATLADGSTPYLFFMKGGSFTAWTREEDGTGTSIDIGSYQLQEWYTVKAVIDVASSRMDVYLDGEKQVSGQRMRMDASQITGLRIICASERSTGTTCIDDVRMYRTDLGAQAISVSLSDGQGNTEQPTLYTSPGTKQIAIAFSQAIDQQSAADGGIRFLCNGGELPVERAFDTETNTYYLTLGQVLPTGADCVLVCGEGLKTVSGISLPAAQIWRFRTGTSRYLIDGPRWYVDGSEILRVEELEDTPLQLEVALQAATVMDTAQPVTAYAAHYRGGELQCVDMARTVLPADGTAAEINLSLPLQPPYQQSDIKVYLWGGADGMTPEFSDALLGGANQMELLLQSGYEENVTVGTPGNTSAAIDGADLTLPEPNDWTAFKNSTVQNAHIQFEKGTQQERSAEITQDPVAGRDNRVLHFQQSSVNTASKARVQLNVVNKSGVRDVYIRQRVYLGEGFRTLLQYPDAITWMSLAEFWNKDGWSDELFPYRVTLGIVKDAVGTAGGETVYPDFYFGIDGQKAETNHFVDQWREKNTQFTVPIGKWMTWELYYREGDRNNGRLVFAVTPEGEERTVVFHINGWTHGPGNPNPTGLPQYHPLKLYTSKDVSNFVGGKGGSLDVYWDDLQLWTSVR